MSNVLATQYMIPLYKGKVIVYVMGPETKILALTQEQVDAAIQNESTFSDYSSLGPTGFDVSRIKFDNQQPIVLGEDTINRTEVPGDLLFNITVEPQFILVNE